ncbi:MAG TPA: DNA polymerase ligase N-terminal domain-containing protein [Acidobacteriota bacterium]|nr:DNA polymerase ligase N-terminal domain-containing protein [Acidobacteriota bacterium]
MADRFVIHQHKTGKPHYDLRIIQNDILRCWSLLHEPPRRSGEQRLAIERESFDASALDCTRFEEQAFGIGNAYVWDKGDLNIADASAKHLLIDLQGAKLSGKYELKRMRWYPGNRWLLRKK